jgi:hypothetical protein
MMTALPQLMHGFCMQHQVACCAVVSGLGPRPHDAVGLDTPSPGGRLIHRGDMEMVVI